MEHITEVKVKLSKEEIDAIKTIAGIKCGSIRCSECPLALSKETYLSIPSNLHRLSSCFRNIAVDLAYGQGELKLRGGIQNGYNS